jgi:DNA-binding transcriptional MerR regulator
MKSPDAFRTISEAASELGVPQHVLRFWETKFSFIRPMKRAGGRRFYRRQDIDVLRGVRVLLHDEGYTIKGVQKLHKDMGMRRILAAGGGDDAAAADPYAAEPEVEAFDRPLLGDAARQRLGGVLGDLEGVKARLDALLKG